MPVMNVTKNEIEEGLILSFQDLNEQVHADRERHYANRTAEPFKYPAKGVRGEDTLPSVKCGFKHIWGGENQKHEAHIVNHMLSGIVPYSDQPDLGLDASERAVFDLWKDVQETYENKGSMVLAQADEIML